MKKHKDKVIGEMPGICPDWPAPGNVHAWSTFRTGGVSEAPYDQLNLADHVGDDKHTVSRNRQLLKQSLALPSEPCWLEQVHGIDVIEASTAMENNVADGSFASKPGHVCVVMTADCLPVLLCNKQGTVVAAVHAGWRGLLQGVIPAAVEKLQIQNEHILAWLGPAIGPQSFEVGREVKEAFMNADLNNDAAFLPSTAGHFFANLYQLAELQLKRLGIKNVYGQKWCTYQDKSHYFSYRRDGVTGRMASLIWLSE